VAMMQDLGPPLHSLVKGKSREEEGSINFESNHKRLRERV